MNCTKILYAIAVGVLFGLLVSSCDREGVSEPTIQETSLSPEGSPIGGPEYLAVLKPGKNVFELAKDEDLHIIRYAEDSNILLFTSANKSRGDLEKIKGFSDLELNEIANLSDGVNLIVGFVEFGWDETMYPTQTTLACLGLDDVHPHARGDGIRVAVIDTGVDPRHPHIAGQLEIINDPTLGYPYEYDPDLVVPGEEPYPAFGHGTHVAGTILTVAPGATIVPFRALPKQGTGTDFEVAVALHSALKAGVDVVNMSLRLQEDSDVVKAMIARLERARVVMVTAAGNNTEDREPVFPASDQRTIAVAATSSEDNAICNEIADFSALGIRVDFGAVGVEVMSSVPGGKLNTPPWVKSATGTSVACAIATGSICAAMGDLLDAKIPGDEIEMLRRTALRVTNGSVLEGRISVYHALGLDE